MKLRFLVFGVVLGLAATWQACKTEQREEQPAPAPVKDKVADNRGGPQMSQDPPLTLAEIDADPFTTLIAVPGGYNLEMNGVWNYSEAYLLVGAVQGDTAEVYVFENETEYLLAACDHKWAAARNEGGQITAVSCDASGTNCTVSAKCLTKCVDPA